MAENSDPSWRDRLNTDRETDKRAIQDGLNTTAGTFTVIGILALLLIWSIVGSFV